MTSFYKKSFTATAILILTIYIATIPQKSYAIPVVCTNCSTWVTQLPELAEQTISAGANVITGVNQTLDTVNNKVLIPIRDTMTAIALVTSGKMIINLVVGSTGVDPLLIRNPRRYVEDQAQGVVRGVVQNPDVAKALKEAGNLQTVVKGAQYQAQDLHTKLQAINTSDIPKIAQDKLCTDAALSAQAKHDVMNTDGTYSQADYTARKREINRNICGDLSNPRTQAALMAVANKTFDWDTWLAQTGGDNKWAQGERTKQLIAAEQARKEELAKRDLDQGKGIRSETVCIKRARPGDDNSECLETKILNTGDTLNRQLSDAAANPLALSLAGFGKGAGSLIANVASIAGSAYTVQNNLKRISQGFGGGGGSSASRYANNTAVTLQETPTNDLQNDPGAKSSITKSPKEQLNDHRSKLTDLVRVDTTYLGVVNTERSNLDSMIACYNGLVSSYSELAEDSRIIQARNYYGEHSETNRKDGEAVNQEMSLAREGISIIDATLARINQSMSSQEILSAFLAYQDDFKAKNIPEITASIERDGKLQSYKHDVERAPKENGDIYNFNNTCTQIRQEKMIRNGQWGNFNGNPNGNNIGGDGGGI